ncbi:MAG: sensor histidine kinase [Anaerolineales bacterium]
MTTRRSTNWIYQGVFYLAAGLIYAAVLLRSTLIYRDTPVLGQVLGLLLLFLGLFLSEMALTRHGSIWFHIYLVLQAILTSLLIYGPEFKEYDYYSLLFAILGMQAMRYLNSRASFSWFLVFFVLIGVAFFRFEGPVEGLTRLLLFGSVIVFLASYSLAARRAQEARSHNQSLMLQLQDANQQLEKYSDTLEKLGVARERQRLARELHDSVTQTIFSMTLTTQSALLLLERDPNRVGAQLERLSQLTQSALVEMHTLISELRPEQVAGVGLVTSLRQHINDRHLPEGLAVTLEVDGEQALFPLEDQGLFRIAQEALNNVVKHASATRASLRLHMDEPFWIEIVDNGQGFDLQQPQGGGRVGLPGMRERAAEIGWNLIIQSGPGEGTHIRVEKKYPGEERV